MSRRLEMYKDNTVKDFVLRDSEGNQVVAVCPNEDEDHDNKWVVYLPSFGYDRTSDFVEDVGWLVDKNGTINNDDDYLEVTGTIEKPLDDPVVDPKKWTCRHCEEVKELYDVHPVFERI